MSGIFPDESSGGALPEDATNSYDPENPATCEPRFFGRNCETFLRPDQLNALISEILCAVDTLGLPYNCSLVCNLGTALQLSFDAVYARINDAIQGLDVKQSVRAATTANITLSGLQNIDGVNVATGDRVLVKNQTTGSQNGIYVVAVGAWARAPDANADQDVTSGMYTFVSQGTLAGKTGWVLTTPDPIVVGTTALVFEQFSAAGQVIDGPGLFFTGNVLGVGTASTSRIVVNPNNIDLATTGVTPGSYGQVVVDAYGRVTGGGNDIADNVNVSPAGGIASTNVQDALEELDNEKARKDANLGDMTDKKASRSNIQITGIQTVGNANAAIVAPATYVVVGAALTAARVFTLPAANAYNPGESILIYDYLGAATTANKISVIRAGADTIDGVTTAVDVITLTNGAARLVSNGVDRWSPAQKSLASVSGYKFLRRTIVTAPGVTTYNKPSDAAALLVKVISGGGGGGSASGSGSGVASGSGGGGGAYAEAFITAPAASYSVTNGAGGTAGTGGGGGGNGGASSFGAFAVAGGGQGGLGGAKTTSQYRSADGGLGGVPSAGDVLIGGGKGRFGLALGASANGFGGEGGQAAHGGPGGMGAPHGGTGNGGVYPGGGGGGGCEDGGVNRSGGAGGNGMIVIEEYGL